MTEQQLNNALLAGGVEIEVEFTRKPDQEARAAEKVFVREIAVEEYPKLLASIEDEAKQAELYCSKPAGWAKELRPRALMSIVKTGDALNKDPFFEWCARRVEMRNRMAPEIKEEIKRRILAELERSQSGRGKSPSSAA